MVPFTGVIIERMQKLPELLSWHAVGSARIDLIFWADHRINKLVWTVLSRAVAAA
jgi:hypothetical protein